MAHWLLRGATFQLKELRWEAREEGEEMAAFLSTQRRLETLYLSDGLSHPVDPRGCFTLRLLSGDSATVGRILLGRPGITHLHWLSSTWEYNDAPASLPLELHRITHFSIQGFNARLRLPAFGSNYRDLVAMKLYYIYTVRVSLAIESLPFVSLTSIYHLQPEIPVTSTIPKLKTLVLLTMYFTSPKEESLIQKPVTVMKRLFEGTPPLCTIVTDRWSILQDGTSHMLYYWWNRSQIAVPLFITKWTHQKAGSHWPQIEDCCFEEHIEEL